MNLGPRFMTHVTSRNTFLWMILAFQAGVVNIGGLMACHRYVSHVTGFATFFGYDIVEGQYAEALKILAVPMFFLFGAMISGELIDTRLRMGKMPRYYISFGSIFFLIALVWLGGLANLFGPFGGDLADPGSYSLLALLCLVCGIQNGTVTTVSRSVVRTTHLTGITTDLGIGIVRYLNRKRSSHRIDDEVRANYMRFAIIFGFVCGSGAGAVLFKAYDYGAFLLPTFTALGFFVLAIWAHVREAPAEASTAG